MRTRRASRRSRTHRARSPAAAHRGHPTRPPRSTRRRRPRCDDGPDAGPRGTASHRSPRAWGATAARSSAPMIRASTGGEERPARVRTLGRVGARTRLPPPTTQGHRSWVGRTASESTRPSRRSGPSGTARWTRRPGASPCRRRCAPRCRRPSRRCAGVRSATGSCSARRTVFDGSYAAVATLAVCLFITTWRTIIPIRLGSTTASERLAAYGDVVVLAFATGFGGGLESPFIFTRDDRAGRRVVRLGLPGRRRRTR